MGTVMLFEHFGAFVSGIGQQFYETYEFNKKGYTTAKPQGVDVTKCVAKPGAKIYDLTNNANFTQFKLYAKNHLFNRYKDNAQYKQPTITKQNLFAFDYTIEEYIKDCYPESDAYLIPVPRTTALFVLNADAFVIKEEIVVPIIKKKDAKALKPPGQYYKIELAGEIKEYGKLTGLYHGSSSNFTGFDSEQAGANNPDIMSMFGMHFSRDKRMCETLFCKDKGYLYTAEVDTKRTWRTDECEVAHTVLKYAANAGLLPLRMNLEYLLSLPYFSYHSQSLSNEMFLYNHNKQINIPQWVQTFVSEHLVPQGIDSIEYRNEIEWAKDNRYDFVFLNNDNITIVDIENKNKE